MTKNPQTLIRMANQIAGFFQPYSREEALAGVRSHIDAFWSPAMRRDLRDLIEQGAEGVDQIVIEAVAGSVSEKSGV